MPWLGIPPLREREKGKRFGDGEEHECGNIRLVAFVSSVGDDVGLIRFWGLGGGERSWLLLARSWRMRRGGRKG